ncbi:MAG: ATP-dependent sacrificial sulfur transferase LarE [Planctomycetaceae bacterium]|nr:ATP-dependent sacrificial sulfur transferase LarE [Planctomycetaceae bacterium]
MLSSTLINKREKLLAWLEQAGRVGVAFSAGVDSTVLAKAARLACGSGALALLAESPSLPRGTMEEAVSLAKRIDIPLQILQTGEFLRPEYQANAGNRCYFCKQTLYLCLLERKAELGIDIVVNGTNLDDLGDYRPGLQAAKEFDVRSPFVEVELTKPEIRELARDWDLPVWDKPAAPCLSSRIAHGLEVTVERVRRVDEAESFLKEFLQISELRVRHEFHELARIEVPLSSLELLTREANAATIVQFLRDLGFRYVTVDLAGFRSGSLNDVLQLQI